MLREDAVAQVDELVEIAGIFPAGHSDHHDLLIGENKEVLAEIPGGHVAVNRG
jgi:hypothetical protein